MFYEWISLYTPNAKKHPMQFATMTYPSKYRPGKKAYCIHSIKIPQVILATSAHQRGHFSRSKAHKSRPQWIPYATKWASLSAWKRSLNWGGGFMVELADRYNIVSVQPIAKISGKCFCKNVFEILDVATMVFGGWGWKKITRWRLRSLLHQVVLSNPQG